jgi:hypothetical protein
MNWPFARPRLICFHDARCFLSFFFPPSGARSARAINNKAFVPSPSSAWRFAIAHLPKGIAVAYAFRGM